MADFFSNWTTQVRKGVLELCVLGAIGAEERYAYELVRSLVEAEDLEVSEGTIYPLLSRLRKQGLVDTRLVESSQGPARKYYRLTSTGRAQLKAMRSYFDDLHEVVAQFDSAPAAPKKSKRSKK